jgi:hydroxyacylglutathione hydrolase
MYLQQFFVEGLGHASYLMGSDQTGEAAGVDPRRDISVYLDAARAAGLRLRYALETHVHNDFLSGARQLAETAGAEQVASADAGLRFPHRAVREGDVLRLGEIEIRVLFTPGHTPEHVTYVVLDRARAEVPVLAFTGGDLLVGAVGRPDLLGRELGERLAPLLYDTLFEKILRLEDYVEVLPTHGSGSLCGRGIGGKRTTTIGYERRFNAALQQPSREAFVDYVLNNNPGIPACHRRIRPGNLEGPGDWRLPEPRPLAVEEFRHLAGRGALVVDLRTGLAFGGGHVPGALNIGLGPSFATWAGWLLPADTLLLFILERDDQWEEAVTALAHIGYERVAGYLQGGMAAWVTAGLPLGRTEQWSVHRLAERLPAADLTLVDVRSPAEWAGGHLAGAVHLPLEGLIDGAGALDPGLPLAVICGGGYRSSVAASLLERQGFREVIDIQGGMAAWTAAGYPVAGEEEEQNDVHSTAQSLRVRDEGAPALRRGG